MEITTKKESKKIAATLAVDECSTSYRVEFEPGEALEFVGKAGYYNNFADGDLVRLLTNINDLIPSMSLT